MQPSPSPDELTPKQKRAHLFENVKQLCLLHGISNASKITGISRNTINSWSHRYHWNIPHHLQPKLHQTQLITTPPAEILRDHLLQNKTRSSLALSSYLAKTSEILDVAPDALRLTRRAKDLAEVHTKLFPPEQNSQQIVNIAIVTGQRQIPPAALPIPDTDDEAQIASGEL